MMRGGLGAGYWMPKTKDWMLDAGCWMLGAGCWMLGAGCWGLGAGSTNQNSLFLKKSGQQAKLG